MMQRRISLTSLLDTPAPTVPFRHQKVVSYQLFHQEQKARFGLLYPFLTQEQINLKIKDKWKHLEADQKKNYTKAVLCVTPLKKSTQDLKMASSTPKYLSARKKGSLMVDSEVSSSPVISSQEKVEHWLNDPKHNAFGNGKKYKATQYALNYGVPEIIEETPIKPTGILKNNSFRNSTGGKSKSRNNSRVSFSPRNKNTKSSPENNTSVKVRSLPNRNCTERQNNTVIKNKNVFDFEEIENVELCIEEKSILSPQVRNQNKSSFRTLKIPTANMSYNFKENINLQNKQIQHTKTELSTNDSKQTLKTPENKKKRKSTTPKSKVLRLPKKFKSQCKNQNDVENCNNVLSKSLGPKEDPPKLKPHLNNQSRTDTPTIKQRLRPRHKQFSQESVKSNGFMADSQQADQSVEQSTFYKNRKGLLVGPIINDGVDDASEGSSSISYDHGSNFDDHNASFDDHSDNFDDDDDDDAYYTNHKGLIFGPIPDDHLLTNDKKTEVVEDTTIATVSENKKCIVDEVFPKETKTYTKRHRTIFHNAQQIQKPTDSLSSSNSENTKSKAKQPKRYLEEAIKSKKCINKDNVDDSVTARRTRSSAQQKMLKLSNDVQEQRPLSPTNLMPWEVDHNIESSPIASTADLELSQPQMSQSKTTLAKVLCRMKQIASPIQLSPESSPRLLSPALSGISQLSSLSKVSSDHSDRVLRVLDENRLALKSFQSQSENLMLKRGSTILKLSSLSERGSKQSKKIPKQMDGRKLNLRSQNNGKTKSKHSTKPKEITTHASTENDLLCDMFQDVTLPEKKKLKPKECRLVASNREAKIQNFENVFEEDIFI